MEVNEAMNTQERIDALEKKLLYAQKLRERDLQRLQDAISIAKEEVSFLEKKKAILVKYLKDSQVLVWNDLLEETPKNLASSAPGIRSLTSADPSQTLIPQQPEKSDFKAEAKLPTFNHWKYTEEELLGIIEFFFVDFGLVTEFNIPVYALRGFLLRVKENYNKNPFHNFIHCFCVTQMMYSLLHVSKLNTALGKMELLILLCSCICHDLDHPGYNNSYQVNAQTELAIRYNDQSPLENHHCAVAFTILSEPGCNVFVNVDKDTYKKIRAGIILCILATDMGKHGDIMSRFKIALNAFNLKDEAHRHLLMQILIKCVDISNEVRPQHVSDPWVDCLLEEFFHQSDMEKQQGLPVAPFMDREKVTKAKAQTGFIQFVLIPLYESLSKACPDVEEHFLEPIRASHAYYVRMQKEEEAAAKAAALSQAATENGEKGEK